MAPPWFSTVILTNLARVLEAGATLEVGSVAGEVPRLPPQATNRTRPAKEITGAVFENVFISGLLIPYPG